MEKKFDEYAYKYLLGLFMKFVDGTIAGLIEMMSRISHIADRCEMDTIYEISHYFLTNQIENLPDTNGRFQCLFIKESELENARMLEYYLGQQIINMRVGETHMLTKWQRDGINVSTNDFVEIINDIHTTQRGIHELVSLITESIDDDMVMYASPLIDLMNECLETIDAYIKVACDKVNDGLILFINGVSTCLEASNTKLNKLDAVAIKWPVGGVNS